MAKNLSVYQISDTLLNEIKGAIKNVVHPGTIDASIKKGTVRKISANKKKKVKN
jgi:hypothetical protein